MITKIIDNFGGRLTRENIGDLNSGMAKYTSTFGNDPFTNPTNLTWIEAGIRIDPNGSVITDLIMAGKERVESGISYVYAVGHLGRVYKIQVNDPSTYNSNYDNPVLLTTLTINSPTFTRGGFIDFYGTSEKIYIGHDMGLTTVNFDGSSEAFVGALGSWTQNVPRPLRQFIGNLYIGNGNNIAEVSSAAIVNTYTKLSPAFPDNTQVRDLDLNPSGTYLEAVVSRLALPDVTSSAVDTSLLANSESYIFRWNGTDTGYTSFDSFPAFSLNTNTMFGPHQYVFGYDIAGAAVFNPTQKILSPILSQAPMPNAVGSNGNLVGWATQEFNNGFLRMVNFIYGSLDKEVGIGWWRQFAQSATGSETDVMRVPFHLIVSNLVQGSVTNGYTGGRVSSGKVYFSTLESSAAPTTKYKFYKWFPVATGVNPVIGGIYETQNQTSVRLFRSILRKGLKVHEIRMYTEPLVANNSYQIDVIGTDGNPIANASATFTVGTNATAGDVLCQYNPQMKPSHSIGIRITNLGSANWVGIKCEVDIDEAGK